MNTLADILTYMRRILKTQSNATLENALMIDYVNRFSIMDVPAIMELFDFKTTYQFVTQPGVDQYNMPLYNVQIETTNQSILIIGASRATQCVLMAKSNFQIGQTVTINGVVGMTQLNGNSYTVVGLTTTTITIDVDSSTFTAYVSGGYIVGPNNNNSVVQQIARYPVYQGFSGPAYIDGVDVSFHTQPRNFFNTYPNLVQQFGTIEIGDGTAGPYTLQFPIGISNSNPVNPPVSSIVRGHVDITGIIAASNYNASLTDPIVVDSATATGATTLPGTISAVPVTSSFPAIYINTTNSVGSNMTVADSGQFFNQNVNLGLLMTPGQAPFGNSSLPGGYVGGPIGPFAITGIMQSNPAVLTVTSPIQIGQVVVIQDVVGMTQLNGNSYIVTAITPTTISIDVDSTGFSAYMSGGEVVVPINNMMDYFNGIAYVTFPSPVPQGVNISAQCYYFQPGLPRALLCYNNVITLRSIPDSQYVVQLEAYLTPAAFFNTAAAIPFAYMAEYIARGAARKIMIDTKDEDGLAFYEPFFKEQESFVWKRSQRQVTSTRTQTIYNQGMNTGGQNGFFGIGSSGL
jgi:hypothetical protein